MLGDRLSIEGSCRARGRLTPGDVEGTGLEERVESLEERVESLNDNLSSI